MTQIFIIRNQTIRYKRYNNDYYISLYYYSSVISILRKINKFRFFKVVFFFDKITGFVFPALFLFFEKIIDLNLGFLGVIFFGLILRFINLPPSFFLNDKNNKLFELSYNDNNI